MATLTVGTGSGDYATLADALAAAGNGDTINVPAGVYTNQYENITKNVTINGVGGIAYFVSTQNVPNGKGIFVVTASGNVTISNLAFIGATTTNANGANAAGIRYQSGNLTLSHDIFYNNQDGMLLTPLTGGTGSVTINDSVITRNGVSNPALNNGYGRTHNIYAVNLANFSITGSMVTNANIGHEIKTRALTNSITNNLIADGPNGTSSYSIDTPNSGNTTISGNTIEQGPASQNPAIITNGEEGNLHPGTLSVTGNTIINNDPNSNSRAVVNDTPTTAQVSGNVITGLSQNQVAGGSGPVTTTNNTLTSAQPTVSMKILSGGAVVDQGSATANTLTLQYAGGGYGSLGATAYPGLGLDIAADNPAASAGAAVFEATQTGLTSTSPLAAFFDNNAGLTGATVTWTVYANANDAAFGTSTLLGSRSFTDYGQVIADSSTFALPFSASSSTPYSLTETVTIEMPCFARGTRLLTPGGYRPVETLRPGDPVVTEGGIARPVVWIGWRVIDLATDPDAERLRPVVIDAGAFGPGRPARRLTVSPLHAIFAAGRLVPAALLVNGATIRRDAAALAVTYFHVELDRHDIVIAEGLPSETYRDNGNRHRFVAALGTPGPRRPSCVPLLVGGPDLAALRRDLHERAIGAGFRIVDDAPLVAETSAGRVTPRRVGHRAIIDLLEHTATAPIRLRTSIRVPAETDPASDDRRGLGLCIGAASTDLPDGGVRFGAGWLPRAAGDRGLWMEATADIHVPEGARRLSLDILGHVPGWARA